MCGINCNLYKFVHEMIFFQGTGETVRVVSMDKDFHVDCYVCEVRVVPKTFCGSLVVVSCKVW